MAKYSSTMIIDAFQFDGDFKGSDNEYYVPDWIKDALEEEIVYFDDADLYLVEGEEVNEVAINDYICRDDAGTLTSFTPEHFNKYFKLINEEEA
jgi:hypothetical protein